MIFVCVKGAPEIFGIELIRFRTYLSHFEKDDTQSVAGSILSRNRFPLRNNRLAQQTNSVSTLSSVANGDPYSATTHHNVGAQPNPISSFKSFKHGSLTSSPVANNVANKNLGPIRGINFDAFIHENVVVNGWIFLDRK